LTSCGLSTSAERFDRHKDGVDFSKNLRVFEPEHPTVLLLIIYLEEAETVCRSLGWSAFPPNLERRISLCGASIIQIEGVKDESRFPLCIKHPAECLLVLALAIDVVHVGDMKIA
jgi:hypothetical protein